jgi:hypothetical protein
MKTSAMILLFPAFLVGCAAKERTAPVPLPEYSGVARRAEGVAGSVSKASAGGKEVRALHYESMGLLDRIDYKAGLLLEGW